MRKRIVYFDILNIIAALSVVFLHCNGIAHTFSNTLSWYQALAVEVCLFWPVPVFFMLSGATLIGYRDRYSTKEFIKKRFMRTFVPFVIWSLLNAFINRVNPLDIGIKNFINKFTSSSFEGVYWFFIPLFAVYLAIPVISLLKDNRKILWYMFFMGFFTISFLPPILSYFDLTWNNYMNFVLTGGYLNFAIIGYLISTEELNIKKRLCIYFLGILGILIRYGATVYLTLSEGQINRTFFNYHGYYSVFLAVAVFVFIKYSKIVKKIGENEKFTKLLKTISGCSFGVYLMHMIVYRFLARFITTNCWEWRLLVPFLIYGLCVLCTFILKKIPILKHIVP